MKAWTDGMYQSCQGGRLMTAASGLFVMSDQKTDLTPKSSYRHSAMTNSHDPASSLQHKYD